MSEDTHHFSMIVEVTHVDGPVAPSREHLAAWLKVSAEEGGDPAWIEVCSIHHDAVACDSTVDHAREVYGYYAITGIEEMIEDKP